MSIISGMSTGAVFAQRCVLETEDTIFMLSDTPRRAHDIAETAKMQRVSWGARARKQVDDRQKSSRVSKVAVLNRGLA